MTLLSNIPIVLAPNLIRGLLNLPGGVRLLGTYLVYVFLAYETGSDVVRKIDVQNVANLSEPTVAKHTKILVRLKLLRVVEREGKQFDLRVLASLKQVNQKNLRSVPPLIIKSSSSLLRNNNNNSVDRTFFGTKQQSKVEIHQAEQLYKALKRKGKVMRSANMKAWSLAFSKLRRKEGVSKTRINRVLKWYSKHMGDKFVPSVYSANSFCSKFLKIEDAMDRISPPREEDKWTYITEHE